MTGDTPVQRLTGGKPGHELVTPPVMPGTAPRYSHGKKAGATGMLPDSLPLNSRVPGNCCFLPGNMTRFWTGTGSMNC
ncbi:MAG: hypothetical protein ACFFD4_23975 [Candidatus Odinarchaeota archaeon]